MSGIHQEVVELLSEHPGGLALCAFGGAYRKYFGKDLVLSQHGFKNLSDLFRHNKDCVVSRNRHQKQVVMLLLHMPVRLHSGPRGKTYKDVLLHHSGNRAATTFRSVPGPSSQNFLLKQLEASLKGLMQRHPEGVLLAQVWKSCPLLYNQELLQHFVSKRHLLASLNVVRLQGYGVQTRVFPADNL